ncbi:MAG: alginate export family protein [Desulfobacterales bacterium]
MFIGGGAFTVKKDTLSNLEFRLFDYFYRDDRDIISDAGFIPGGKLEINTVGASVLGVYPDVGAGDFDFMLWGCYQSGDWGEADQEAYAAVAEAGYRLPAVAWQPWSRLGFAYASGDDSPGDDDNETFFNLLPSNHKYHGAMDATAFSNLYDAYLQIILNPMEKLELQMDGHYYMLAEDDEGTDYWYVGSGVYNDEAFGYERRSTGGDDELGMEVDLSAQYQLAANMGFTVGYAHFFGEDATENYYLADEDADWGYAQFDLQF